VRDAVGAADCAVIVADPVPTELIAATATL
jgi:hypothetical protein